MPYHTEHTQKSLAERRHAHSIRGLPPIQEIHNPQPALEDGRAATKMECANSQDKRHQENRINEQRARDRTHQPQKPTTTDQSTNSSVFPQNANIHNTPITRQPTTQHIIITPAIVQPTTSQLSPEEQALINNIQPIDTCPPTSNTNKQVTPPHKLPTYIYIN